MYDGHHIIVDHTRSFVRAYVVPDDVAEGGTSTAVLTVGIGTAIQEQLYSGNVLG